MFNTLDTRRAPSTLDVGTAGTACTRAYVLLILSVLAVFGPSVLLILPSTPSIYDASTLIRYSEYTRSICEILTIIVRNSVVLGLGCGLN